MRPRHRAVLGILEVDHRAAAGILLGCFVRLGLGDGVCPYPAVEGLWVQKLAINDHLERVPDQL